MLCQRCLTLVDGLPNTLSIGGNDITILVVYLAFPRVTVLEFTDVLNSIGQCIGALAMLLAVLPFTDVLASIGICEGALAIFRSILPWTDVLTSTGLSPSALPMPLAVFPFTDVFTSIIVLISSMTILRKPARNEQKTQNDGGDQSFHYMI